MLLEKVIHLERIVGLDEAGRGPLAGPVVAAAVILPLGFDIILLNDSKKMTEHQRLKAFNVISQQAMVGVGWVDERLIDTINILQASLLAMRKAYSTLAFYPVDKAYIDGNKKANLPITEEPVVKGDSKIPAIMAASIVAKTLRDHYMMQLDRQLPQYGFAKHKGYPTLAHRKAIALYGLSSYHRTSFKFS